jgi:hypothetical protein
MSLVKVMMMVGTMLVRMWKFASPVNQEMN